MKISQNNYQEVEKLLEKKKRDDEGGYWYIKSEDIEVALDKILGFCLARNEVEI